MVTWDLPSQVKSFKSLFKMNGLCCLKLAVHNTAPLTIGTALYGRSLGLGRLTWQTLYLFNSSSALAAPLAPGRHRLLSASISLSLLIASRAWDHAAFVLLWQVIPLSVMSYGSIHVVANGRISFLSKWPNNIPLYVWYYLSIGGHGGCFHS